MKRVAIWLTLAVLAMILTGCGAIARIEEARSDRAGSVANAEWARTERVRIAEHSHTERIMILSNERLALAAQANDDDAGGTDHEGGITARVDVGAGVGIGWPALFVLGGLALGVLALMVWPDRRR